MIIGIKTAKTADLINQSGCIVFSANIAGSHKLKVGYSFHSATNGQFTQHGLHAVSFLAPATFAITPTLEQLRADYQLHVFESPAASILKSKSVAKVTRYFC